MPRLLGLDFGSKRVGYAVTDEEQSIAFPRGILEWKSENDFLEKLRKIIDEEHIGGVVIGLPLGEENEETETSTRLRKLGEKIGVPVFYVDEFLSTDEALAKIPFRRDRQKKRGIVDAVSAQLILERYLSLC